MAGECHLAASFNRPSCLRELYVPAPRLPAASAAVLSVTAQAAASRILPPSGRLAASAPAASSSLMGPYHPACPALALSTGDHSANYPTPLSCPALTTSAPHTTFTTPTTSALQAESVPYPIAISLST